MNNIALQLVDLCEAYLDARLPIQDFIERYQCLFEDEMDKLSPEEEQALDNIFMACEYYEPNPELRADSTSYIGKTGLNDAIRSNLRKLLT